MDERVEEVLRRVRVDLGRLRDHLRRSQPPRCARRSCAARAPASPACRGSARRSRRRLAHTGRAPAPGARARGRAVPRRAGGQRAAWAPPEGWGRLSACPRSARRSAPCARSCWASLPSTSARSMHALAADHDQVGLLALRHRQEDSTPRPSACAGSPRCPSRRVARGSARARRRPGSPCRCRGSGCRRSPAPPCPRRRSPRAAAPAHARELERRARARSASLTSWCRPRSSRTSVSRSGRSARRRARGGRPCSERSRAAAACPACPYPSTIRSGLALRDLDDAVGRVSLERGHRCRAHRRGAGPLCWSTPSTCESELSAHSSASAGAVAPHAQVPVPRRSRRAPARR